MQTKNQKLSRKRKTIKYLIYRHDLIALVNIIVSSWSAACNCNLICRVTSICIYDYTQCQLETQYTVSKAFRRASIKLAERKP